jgi:hypothetical protein
MKIELADAIWLDEREELSLAEMAELSGLTETELEQLVEYEALPAAFGRGTTTFTAGSLVAARAACRLREDFELDAGALALVLALLERIHELEAKLQAIECQFPRHRR